MQNLAGLHGQQPGQSVSCLEGQLWPVNSRDVQMKCPDPAKPVRDILVPAPVEFAPVKTVFGLFGAEMVEIKGGSIRSVSPDVTNVLISKLRNTKICNVLFSLDFAQNIVVVPEYTQIPGITGDLVF